MEPGGTGLGSRSGKPGGTGLGSKIGEPETVRGSKNGEPGEPALVQKEGNREPTFLYLVPTPGLDQNVNI